MGVGGVEANKTKQINLEFGCASLLQADPILRSDGNK